MGKDWVWLQTQGHGIFTEHLLCTPCSTVYFTETKNWWGNGLLESYKCEVGSLSHRLQHNRKKRVHISKLWPFLFVSLWLSLWKTSNVNRFTDDWFQTTGARNKCLEGNIKVNLVVWLTHAKQNKTNKLHHGGAIMCTEVLVVKHLYVLRMLAPLSWHTGSQAHEATSVECSWTDM